MSDSMPQPIQATSLFIQSESNALPTSVDHQLPAPLVFNDIDAAIYLGVKPTTLRKWRSLGTGPKFIKVGRKVKYALTDLREYLRKQTVSR
jgi:hypothetical protein